MTIADQRGAAFHEAGHAVAAWSLGLKVRRLAIAIDGDDAKGAAEIEQKNSAPLVDQIAIWVAGGIAQELFAAATNENATIGDMVEVHSLTEDFSEQEAEALRYAGYRRAEDLLTQHRNKVEELAGVLARRKELDQRAIEQILP